MLKNLDIELKTGDILSCYSYGFLSWVIRLFTRGQVSHTAGVVELWGNVFIVEAQANGINLKSKEQWVKKYDYNYIVHRPKKLNITNYKKKVTSKIGVTGYDFFSLIVVQPFYIFTGKWIGKKNDKAEKRMYCSEFIAWLHNKPNFWELSPQALYDVIDEDSKYIKID